MHAFEIPFPFPVGLWLQGKQKHASSLAECSNHGRDQYQLGLNEWVVPVNIRLGNTFSFGWDGALSLVT